MRNTLVFVAAMLVTSMAFAQGTTAPASGPVVPEPTRNEWVLAQDFKVTQFDDRTGELAGAYGGRLIDGTILIGAGGYWLANDRPDFKLTYGGVIVGWQSPEFGRIRFGGRGLVGVGRAMLGFDATAPRGSVPVPDARPGDIRFGVSDPRAQLPVRTPVPQQFPPGPGVGRDDFFVFEPQANVSARLTRAIGVSCGVGYRETAQTDILQDRINGPTANLSIHFGW